MRYYYFLAEEFVTLASLSDVFKQNKLGFLSFLGNDPASDFLEQPGFYYSLTDAADKIRILVVKITSEGENWENGWNLLQDWEKEADLQLDELTGRLTVLFGQKGNLSEMVQEAAALIPNSEAESRDQSCGPLVRLSASRKEDSSYVYAPDDSENVVVSFLARRLPILYGQIIYLLSLDDLLSDRNNSVRREKEELERDLMRILHTKIVMSQSTLIATEELEQDIEKLAIAFAKLVGDQNLISDGIKSLESVMKSLETQITQEPALHESSKDFRQMVESYQGNLGELQYTYDELNLTRNNYQAAIEVVQSKIQVMNSRTNIATQEQIKGLLEVNTDMQKKSLIFQYAAGLIEFIVMAYYSHSFWTSLVPAAYAVIPAWIQLTVAMLFSGNIVLVTHLMAEYIQGAAQVRLKLFLAGIILLLFFSLIVLVSMTIQSHGLVN